MLQGVTSFFWGGKKLNKKVIIIIGSLACLFLIIFAVVTGATFPW